MKKIIALVIASMFLLVSCGEAEQPENISRVEQKKESVTVYFADENASGLVAEVKEVSEKTVETAVEALLSGSEHNVAVIGEGTRLIGPKRDGLTMTADFSGEFLQSYGDTLAIYSVVNTITEFEDISFVKITVNGAEDAVLGNYALSEVFTRNESILLK